MYVPRQGSFCTASLLLNFKVFTHLSLRSTIPSSKCHYIQGSDSSLETPLEFLTRSLRRSLPLEVSSPSSRCPHLWGHHSLLKDVVDFEVLSLPEVPLTLKSWLALWDTIVFEILCPPRGVSWGSDFLLKMPLFPGSWFPARDTSSLKVLLPFSRRPSLRLWFHPEGVLCLNSLCSFSPKYLQVPSQTYAPW